MNCINKFFSAIVLTLSIFIPVGSANAQVAAIGAIDEQIAGGGKAQAAGVMSARNRKPSTPRNVSATASKNRDNKSRKTVKAVRPATSNNTTRSSSAKPAPAIRKQTYEGFPIAGDQYSLLNSEVAVPVRPVYRNSAKEAGAAGYVMVDVVVSPKGDVLSAKAKKGNSLLYPEAEKAALATKFNKPTVYGRPAKGIGFIVFKFGDYDEYQR